MKKNIYFLLITFLFVALTNCSNKKNDSSIHNVDESYFDSIATKVTFQQPIEYIRPTPKWLERKLGLYKSKVWIPDSSGYVRWRIKWYDGDADIQNRVRQFVDQTFSGTNIKIEYGVTENPTHIIAFIQNNQAWSYLGTDCQYIAANNQITMNLGWAIRYRQNQDNELFGLVSHEFKHAAGFTHTLQSPACVGVLNWIKSKVYADCKQWYGWDQTTVDQQILTPYSPNIVQDDTCDLNSNMCYRLYSGWAVDKNGKPLLNGRNNAETYNDRKVVRLIYKNPEIIKDTIIPPPPIKNDTVLLSLNKPVKASSVFRPLPTTNYDYCAAEKAVDGKVGYQNYFASNREMLPWLEIDLGSVKNITSIVIENRWDCCANYLNNFSILIDNEKVLGITTNMINKTKRTFQINRKGQFFKIRADGMVRLNLSEISIFGF